MGIQSAVIDAALTAAAMEAKKLPVEGAGTLSTQVKIFGLGATGMAAEAEAILHEKPF